MSSSISSADIPTLTVTSADLAIFAENGTGVAYTATAISPQNGTLTWELTGTDVDLFNINAATGEVTFKATPDYEVPSDSNKDNVYNITVLVTDGIESSPFDVAITVTNANDVPQVRLSLPLEIVFSAFSNNPFAALDVGTFSSPAFADLDGDGDVDLVVGRADGTLLAYEKTAGGFTPFASNPFAAIDVGTFSSPAFADLSGDGVLDLVVGTGDGRLLAYERTATGFAAFTFDPFGVAPSDSAIKPALVDLDGNGYPDLVAWTNSGEQVSLGVSVGFSPLVTAPPAGASIRNAPAFADLDGDGDFDLVMGAEDGTLVGYENTAEGFRALATDPFAGIDVGGSSSPSFADLDGDGDLDLVVGNSDGTLVAFERTGGPQARFLEKGTGVVFTAKGEDQDGDTLTWSISGGADAALFMIDPTTGEVRFRNAPDAAAPADAGGNNVYDISVRAWDGKAFSTPQAVAIAVTSATATASISALSAAKAEGQAATTAFTFTVTRTGNTDGAQALDWSVTGSGANPAAALDFDGGTLPSGTVSFAIGETSKTITINVAGDTAAEAIEGFTVTLSNPTNNLALGTSSATGTILNDDFAGTAGADTISGTPQNDTLEGLAGNDDLMGLAGNDVLNGGGGNDTLDGGEGLDRALFTGLQSAYRFALDGNTLIVSGPDGTDRLTNIEALNFGGGADVALASLQSSGLLEEVISLQSNGSTNKLLPELYSGPVNWLNYAILGSNTTDIAIGTSRNDFFNLLAGDDAANGGAGDDVIDGGTGSNFLTGGTGRDDFFLDGRDGSPTWATITDWEAGERLSVWGWRPGVSQVVWVDNAGAPGWTGVTMHGDLDGNGAIDTSVTWTGLTRDQLPTPLQFDGLLWFV